MSLLRLGASLVGLILWGIGSGAAWAQTVLVTPSLSTSESYDDNVRLTPTKRQDDFVTNVIPRLRLEARDYPWDVTFDGSVRAQYLARLTELNTTTDNWTVGGTAGYRLSPTVNLSLTDSYVRSLNTGTVGGQPGVITGPQTSALTGVPSGIVTGRFASTSNTVSPAVSYQITSRTGVSARYSFQVIRSDAPGALDSDTHEAGFSVQHQLAPRTAGTSSYTFDRFQTKGLPDRDSHSPRIGFIFAYSPTIRFVTDTGLLLLQRGDGSEEVTWASSTRYEQTFTQGGLSLGYDRNASVAGVLGVPSVTQTLTVLASYQALRDLTLSLQGSLSDVQSSGGGATQAHFLVSSAALRVSYRILRWLALEAQYQNLHQDDRKGPLTLDRNVFFLGLTASDQFRVR